MSMTYEHSPLITIRQAAELSNVHPNTIRNNIKTGKLPALRLGRNVIRIRITDLEGIFTSYLGGEFGTWRQSLICMESNLTAGGQE